MLWALRAAGHDLPGLDVLVDGHVPLGAGLSSSAALECSVAVAVAHLLGLDDTEETRRGLAAACIRAESESAGAPTGGMDQTVALLAQAGTALLIDFDDDTARPVALAARRGRAGVLVTDTRVSHALVDGGYAARRADCEAAAAALGVPSLRHADEAAVARWRTSGSGAGPATSCTRSPASPRPWRRCTTATGPGRTALRRLARLHALRLRDLLRRARPWPRPPRDAGALGARMTGGGFGGSAISLVPRERLDAVVRAVDLAFAAAGYRAPAHLIGEPSAAAGLVGLP